MCFRPLPLLARLGEFQRILGLAAAAHAVKKKLATLMRSAEARAEVCVKLLQYSASAIKESRDW